MNCDWIAPYYRWFEYLGFGRELERRRSSLLPTVTNARRVLVLGDGDGRFLARLTAHMPAAHIDSIEASRRMAELAQRRSGQSVRHIRADARFVPLAAGEYDLIATHFFLDCFDEHDAPRLVEHIARAAAPDARWLVSEFRQATGGWRATWSRAWISFLYFFFRLATGLETRRLVDHRPLLKHCGFRLVREETARFGMLASELWQKI